MHPAVSVTRLEENEHDAEKAITLFCLMWTERPPSFLYANHFVRSLCKRKLVHIKPSSLGTFSFQANDGRFCAKQTKPSFFTSDKFIAVFLWKRPIAQQKRKSYKLM